MLAHIASEELLRIVTRMLFLFGAVHRIVVWTASDGRMRASLLSKSRRPMITKPGGVILLCRLSQRDSSEKDTDK